MAARERSETRREQIIDAALQVVAEDGLGRFTTAAIAKVVGVTDAALFRHFESKEAIVLAAIDRIERALFADFPPRHEDPVERLGAFFLARVRSVSALPGVADVMFSEQLAQAAGPEGVRQVRAMQHRTVAFIRDCLADAKQQGRLRDDAEPDDLFVLVRGALLALLHPDARKGSERSRRAQADRIWSLLEGTLRRSDAP